MKTLTLNWSSLERVESGIGSIELLIVDRVTASIACHVSLLAIDGNLIARPRMLRFLLLDSSRSMSFRLFADSEILTNKFSHYPRVLLSNDTLFKIKRNILFYLLRAKNFNRWISYFYRSYFC